MAKATGDFICLTDVPRAAVANALQVQAQRDIGDAIIAIREAFKVASGGLFASVHAAAQMQELRNAVASARLTVNVACDLFNESIAAGERLFQAGIDVQDEEPPQEEAHV